LSNSNLKAVIQTYLLSPLLSQEMKFSHFQFYPFLHLNIHLFFGIFSPNISLSILSSVWILIHFLLLFFPPLASDFILTWSNSADSLAVLLLQTSFPLGQETSLIFLEGSWEMGGQWIMEEASFLSHRTAGRIPSYMISLLDCFLLDFSQRVCGKI
jgi:hypothetical protein